MIIVGIDVAKFKHECFITNSEGEVLFEPFPFKNTPDGFADMLAKVISTTDAKENIKIGLESTGHYHLPLLRYLLKQDLRVYLINPLQASLYRKSQSFRKTKTDSVDARMIAKLVMSESTLQPYSGSSYQKEELKSLTRYRAKKVNERASQKTSLTRLVDIIFPELNSLVPEICSETVYCLLSEFPDAPSIASAHLTRLSNLLLHASRGRYGKEEAIRFRKAAKESIGISSPAFSLELRHTIELIRFLTEEISEVEQRIDAIVKAEHPKMLSVPGIGKHMAAAILGEVGDFKRFSSPDKLLAYAGLSPTTYQSGQLTSTYAKMEKRGSKYLRYAFFQAAKHVCRWDPIFRTYYEKKKREGKHHYVALSHVAKKLVRLIYHLETTGESYISKAA